VDTQRQQAFLELEVGHLGGPGSSADGLRIMVPRFLGAVAECSSLLSSHESCTLCDYSCAFIPDGCALPCDAFRRMALHANLPVWLPHG